MPYSPDIDSPYGECWHSWLPFAEGKPSLALDHLAQWSPESLDEYAQIAVLALSVPVHSGDEMLRTFAEDCRAAFAAKF